MVASYEDAARLCLALNQHGFQCYIVGGAVRDMMMGKIPHDYDMATDATPQQIAAVFKNQKTIPTGEKFGTMTVLANGEPYQITTYRTEQGYNDKRKPDEVRFSKSLKEDLERRDLTINAMAMDPRTREVIDPFQGKKDIELENIRAVGNPEERFGEDYLRMLRACRFQARLGFNLDPETKQAIRKHSKDINQISGERIRDELLGMLQAEHPASGIECLRETGLLAETLPEVNETVEVSQPSQFHTKDVYNHTLDVVEHLPATDPNLRMAGLLHDIGKPATKKFVLEKGRAMFIGHEDVGAVLAEERLRELKFSKADMDRIVGIVKNHMLKYSKDWSDATIRRWINKVGMENVADLITFKKADCKSSRVDCDDLMQDLETRIAGMSTPVVTTKNLAIDGRAIMRTLNIPPGPAVGAKLKALENLVIENPDLNTEDQLLMLLLEIV